MTEGPAAPTATEARGTAPAVPHRARIRLHALMIALLTSMFLGSLVPRHDAVLGSPSSVYWTARFWNTEVPVHVLSVLHAWRDIPAERHWFLPIDPPDPVEIASGRRNASLPAAEARADLTGTASRLDRDGNLVYTSFPPGVFLATAAALAAVGAEPTLFALRAFNLTLHAATAGLLYLLMWRLFFARSARPALASALCAAAAATYVFAVGPMHDHVATLWSHHVFQPILLLVLIAVSTRNAWALRAVAMGCLALMGVLTEWTSHLLNAGTFVASLWLAWRTEGAARRGHRLAAFATVLGECAGVALLAAVYEMRIGLGEVFGEMLVRGAARATGSGGTTLGEYLRSLAWGMGPHAMMAAFAVAAAALLVARPPRSSHGRSGDPSLIGPIMAILCLACLENAVLMSHAVTYPFAQLKLVLFLALVIGGSLASMERGSPVVAGAFAFGGSVAAAALSVMVYSGLYGNRVDGASGKPLYETACLSRGALAAKEMLETLRVGEVAASTPAFPVALVLGRPVLSVGTLGVAERALAELPHATGIRVFLLSGHGFDRAGDWLSVGGASADVLISRGGGAVVSLRPEAQAPGVARAAQAKLRFHNPAAVSLVATGTVLEAEDGIRYEVTVAAPAALEMTVRRSDGLPIPVSPTRLVGRIALDERTRSLPLKEERVGQDETGCRDAP